MASGMAEVVIRSPDGQEREAGLLDPTLDAPGHFLGRSLGSIGSLERYQRLVANPFLGILALVGSFVAIRMACETERFDVVMVATGTIVFARWFLQFHCLDCGATGRLSRWRQHACPAVVFRLATRCPRRFRGPTPPTQTALWLVTLVLGIAALLLYRA
jgi:hypothetical protein